MQALAHGELVQRRCDPPAAGMALACVAAGLPMLLAFNLPPSATYFNQAASLLGWGAWVLHLAGSSARTTVSRTEVAAQVTLGLLFVVLALSPVLGGQPWALALSGAALIASAALVAALGGAAARSGLGGSVFLALCVAFLLAGLASCVIGMIQVYVPTWADGELIARSTVVGRSVGNLRQPNHLCSLLLWSIAAALWLGEAQYLRRALGIAFAGVMLFVVVLSGSRSGVLGAFLLALWGLLDTRLAKSTRAALLLAPLAYGLFWSGATTWAPQREHAFGGAGRFSTSGDISSSRFGIWSNTLELTRTHPWAGVGFGEFNFAWTLTEFPNRPVAFFDHTHNLPLQFAVELGLPFAALVLALLGWALWRAWRNCLLPPAPEEGASPQRAAFVMVLLMLMHSLLEYPLWYAYFLLPTAFMLGLCLAGRSGHVVAAAPAPRAQLKATTLRVAALVLMLGAAYSVYDYFKVVVIFAPPENATPLSERIARGQLSVFFSHHADYAAATTSEDPVFALAAAQRAAHYLLDTRLMTAWANALHATGDSERAKYLAQRLREFRNPQSVSYFAPCDDPAVAQADKPYQCFAPQRKFTFADFR